MTSRLALKKKFGNEWEEIALRWVVSPKNASLSGDGETYMMGNNASAGTFSFVSSALEAWRRCRAGGGAARIRYSQIYPADGAGAAGDGAGDCHSLVLMFSVYSPKAVVTVSFAMFAPMFLTFWWEFAGWLDDRLIDIVWQRAG